MKDAWKYVQQIEQGLSGLKKVLDLEEPPNVFLARQMLSVLTELDRRGGKVLRAEFLEIGEMFQYERQGMAGFYQGLVTADGGATKLTNKGRKRMVQLAKHFEPLQPKV
jgi:hypothetical protein